MKNENYDRQEEYERDIEPLLHDAMRRCKELDIPMHIVAQFSHEDNTYGHHVMCFLGGNAMSPLVFTHHTMSEIIQGDGVPSDIVRMIVAHHIRNTGANDERS